MEEGEILISPSSILEQGKGKGRGKGECTTKANCRCAVIHPSVEPMCLYVHLLSEEGGKEYIERDKEK